MNLPTHLDWIFLPTAFALGAVHALEPGHGKTLIATYLIGARGTPKHAVILGFSVTVTHTAVIFALALVALCAGAYLNISAIQRWLEIVSAIIVVAMGAWMLRARWRDYRHFRAQECQELQEQKRQYGYTHEVPQPDASGKLSLAQLVSFGVSGGLLPCPAAMMLLLLAIGAGQYTLGFFIVLVFSLGLAATLIGIGIAVCQSVKFGERFVKDRPIVHLLPFLSAVFVTAMGLALLYKAIFAPAFSTDPVSSQR